MSPPRDQASVMQSLSGVNSHVSAEEVNKVRMEQNLPKEKKKGGCKAWRRREGEIAGGLVGSFESLVGKAGEEAGVRES